MSDSQVSSDSMGDVVGPPIEIVETLHDIDDCPRCGNVCQWTYQHWSDGNVTSYDMCICGA